MFKSFFPNPKWFFISIIIWAAICAGIWYNFNDDIGALLGLDLSNKSPVIGLGHFVTPSFILFYLYYFVSTSLFALFWFYISRHPWQLWSIWGSALILFNTYFSVQASVALNNWRGPFYDMIQKALSGEGLVQASDLYGLALVFLQIALVAIAIAVLNLFFVSHYIFRWRTAMNNYYVKYWATLRNIEGASQRVQEDTMRFSSTMERLGVSMIDSVMTLFAFLPILLALSVHVKELPIIGEIISPLVIAAIFWSLFGTFLLAIVGIKLPGLEFKNQRVEAAYRKELVYGEDHEDRAEPILLGDLFNNVRKNYFRLYFHYMYFNVARYLYLQTDNLFATLILVPTIVAGKITLGIFQQIVAAFSQVSNSFQYLVNSWPTIVELISVYKRLKSFEAAIHDKPLPEIDQNFTANQ